MRGGKGLLSWLLAIFLLLLGYDLSITTPSPGDDLYLTLHWQALKSTEKEYTPSSTSKPKRIGCGWRRFSPSMAFVPPNCGLRERFSSTATT